MVASRDLVLRAGQALAHRLEREEEGAGDLLGREAAEGAQGEGDLRVERRPVVISQPVGFSGSPFRGQREGFLCGVLGELDVAEDASSRPKRWLSSL